MAPKAARGKASPATGSKRASVAPTPESKKAKVQERKPKQDTTVVVLRDVLKMSDLPEACREMLAAGLPSLSATPAMEWHEHQAMVVSWIEQVIEGVRSKLQEAIDTAKEKESACEGKKAEVEVALKEAQEASADAKAKVEAKAAAHKEATEAMSEAESTLETKLAEQRRGDAGLEKVGKEVDSLTKFLDTQVAYLKKEEDYNPKEAAKQVKSLTPLARKLGLDESLLVALAPAGAKVPSSRGEFDNMVLGEIEGSIQKKIAEQKGVIEAGNPEREKRAEAVATAKAAVSAAEGQVTELATALSSLQEEEAAAVAALAKAQEAVDAAESERESAATARGHQEEELDGFIGYQIEHFKMLCKKPEPEPEEKKEEEVAAEGS